MYFRGTKPNTFLYHVYLNFDTLFLIKFLFKEGQSSSIGAKERRGGELKCYRHTDIQTYRQTYRPSYEAGHRGAFAPKNTCPLSVKGASKKKLVFLADAYAKREGGGVDTLVAQYAIFSSQIKKIL